MLKVNDLFCGCGGMGSGFKSAGFKIVGAWDIDKYAVQSYVANVDPNGMVADITKMKHYDLPKAHVWTFGFPCQDLSWANAEAEGLAGARSGLFFEVMRLLEETERYDTAALPYVIMAENVVGLKPYLPVLEQEYNKRGYEFKFIRLNSKNFSVPQNRDRYFVVGIRADLNHELYSFPLNHGTDTVIRDILQNEEDVAEKFYLSDKAIEYMGRERNGKPRWEHHTNKVDGIAATLTANMWKGVPYGVIQGLPKVRRFTPRECARLQGFPDSYRIVVSDTQAYKQFGNGVTVKVSNALALSIQKFLTANEV